MKTETNAPDIPQWLSSDDWYATTGSSALAIEATLSAREVVRVHGASRTSGASAAAWDPEWLAPVIGRLHQVLGLPENWDASGGHRIAKSAVIMALDILCRYMWDSTEPPRIEPTVDGGLLLEWYRPGVQLQVEVAPGEQPSILFQLGGDEWEAHLGTEPDGLDKLLLKHF